MLNPRIVDGHMVKHAANMFSHVYDLLVDAKAPFIPAPKSPRCGRPAIVTALQLPSKVRVKTTGDTMVFALSLDSFVHIVHLFRTDLSRYATKIELISAITD